MNLITIAKNSLDPESWVEYETEDIRALLRQEFNGVWPPTARLYHGPVAEINDITPSSESDVERLAELEGEFFVMVYPGEFISGIVLIIAAIVAAVVAIALLKPPTPTLRNTQTSSANNELSDRVNKPRVGGRIPDIYGTVRSTPDLMAQPYKIFENNQEVEICNGVIGVGYYDIYDIKDDTTLFSNIPGASLEIYAPFNSANSGPIQQSIGLPINTPVLNTARLTSVNGQVLRAPNDQKLVGLNNIRFAAPNQVIEIADGGFDFTEKFAPGDNLKIENAFQYQDSDTNSQMVYVGFEYFEYAYDGTTPPAEYYTGQKIALVSALFSTVNEDGVVTNVYDLSGIYIVSAVSLVNKNIGTDESPVYATYAKIELNGAHLINPQWNLVVPNQTGTIVIVKYNGDLVYDLSGTYVILSVSEGAITLNSPGTVNPAWNTLTTTDYLSPTLSTTGDKWIGPFILDSVKVDRIFANYVATNGLYKDDGSNQNAISVQVELEVTPIDNSGTAIGAAQVFQTTLVGSSVLRNTRASTLQAMPTGSTKYSIRSRRITLADLDFKGTVVDEVRWRDAYAVNNISVTNFGNVTSFQSKNYATDGALAIKDRKINMLVTRKLPRRISGSTFTTELYATNQADEILSFVCLDSKIGNRSKSEIDFDSIYGQIQSVRDYFGTSLASEFCYTFDTTNLSFEEIVKTIADSVFCVAYRIGSILKLSFEKETEDSLLIWNHRNKIPGTETRTVGFGRRNKKDGVEYQYIDPEDDALVTLYIPPDRSALNPETVESVGIRNGLQAHMQAYRVWNKIKYQNITTEFTATEEADLLVRNDRILIADNTRPDTQDGDVIEQIGTLLLLSQPVDLTKYSSYSIFLQLDDLSVDAIPISAGPTEMHVVLSRAPARPLVVEDESYAKTTYIIVGDQETREQAFLLSEKDPESSTTCKIKAINYDSRYYQNDSDYINGIIDSNGTII